MSSQLQEENERQEAEKEPLARLKVEGEDQDENSAKKDGFVEPSMRPKVEGEDEKSAKKYEIVEPLARLEVEGENEKSAKKDEIVEPSVRLVRYDSSIPNALDSILPRYVL